MLGFRVQVKESEGLAVSGVVDLVLGDGRLALHAPETGIFTSMGCWVLGYE